MNKKILNIISLVGKIAVNKIASNDKRYSHKDIEIADQVIDLCRQDNDNYYKIASAVSGLININNNIDKESFLRKLATAEIVLNTVESLHKKGEMDDKTAQEVSDLAKLHIIDIIKRAINC
uniref:Uncharacterized protein n=1 Tax=candidate division CPR3 bacterium TaxID=2268181 RepID=A0A7C5UUD7_UNCC3